MHHDIKWCRWKRLEIVIVVEVDEEIRFGRNIKGPYYSHLRLLREFSNLLYSEKLNQKSSQILDKFLFHMESISPK